MTLFNWLTSRKKSTAKAESRLGKVVSHLGKAAPAQSKLSKGGPQNSRIAKQQRAEIEGAAAHGKFHPSTHRTAYETKHGNPAHVDAAFDGDETAGFLLGLWVECRTTWEGGITAKWDESAGVMTWKVGGKSYDFPADFEIATVFARYGSKGKWYWEEWRGRSGAGEFPLLDAGMPLPRR